MGTLMLLGGSTCQLHAAQTAKAMGHRLILADYLDHPPVAALCDRHVQVSTFDVPGCLRAAEENQVDGVLTVGTDQPVYTAARVAEAMGLPMPISVETALRATNKRAMKSAFERHHIPHVPYAHLGRGQSADSLRALGTPLVIKPLDSQGQRGVFKVDTAEEAVRRLEETLQFSRENTALAETYYPSDEVTFSGYLREGRLYPLLLTDRQHMPDPVHIGVCAAHRYPSVHADKEAEIVRICERVAEALEAREGPLYVQLLIGERGVLVNEAACRVGGAFEDTMIPYATGFHILRAVICQAMGEPLDDATLRTPKPRAAGLQMSEQMLFCRPGVITAVTPLREMETMPGMLTVGYPEAVGARVAAMENATARFGYCVLGTTHGDMDRKVRQFYGRLKVTDEQGQSMLLTRGYDTAKPSAASADSEDSEDSGAL